MLATYHTYVCRKLLTKNYLPTDGNTACLLGLCQLCSKFCLKCFWEFHKISPIMLGLLPIMLDYASCELYIYTHIITYVALLIMYTALS